MRTPNNTDPVLTPEAILAVLSEEMLTRLCTLRYLTNKMLAQKDNLKYGEGTLIEGSLNRFIAGSGERLRILNECVALKKHHLDRANHGIPLELEQFYSLRNRLNKVFDDQREGSESVKKVLSAVIHRSKNQHEDTASTIAPPLDAAEQSKRMMQAQLTAQAMTTVYELLYATNHLSEKFSDEFQKLNLSMLLANWQITPKNSTLKTDGALNTLSTLTSKYTLKLETLQKKTVLTGQYGWSHEGEVKEIKQAIDKLISKSRHEVSTLSQCAVTNATHRRVGMISLGELDSLKEQLTVLDYQWKKQKESKEFLVECLTRYLNKRRGQQPELDTTIQELLDTVDEFYNHSYPACKAVQLSMLSGSWEVTKTKANPPAMRESADVGTSCVPSVTLAAPTFFSNMTEAQRTPLLVAAGVIGGVAGATFFARGFFRSAAGQTTTHHAGRAAMRSVFRR